MGLTIKQKVMKAWLESKEVVVCFGERSELTGYVKKWDSEQVGIQYDETGMRPFAYDDLTDIRFVDEGEDRSYPHCDELECKERDGSSVFCRDKECDTRRMFCTYQESIKDDPTPSPPEGETWRIACNNKGEVGLYINGKRKAIILADGLSPGHLRMMAAAPQMRDALVAVQNSYSCHDSGSITCKIRKDIWQQVIDATKGMKRIV